ncbi:MAG: type II toxin-antitoxin system RelE/ParE family toxin [Gammaproteobacteria bacterium]
MIKSWKHKGIQRFFNSGDKSGIIAVHERKLTIILQRLSAITHVADMNTPGMQFHALKGDLSGYYSVSVNGNWRIIFKFDGTDVTHVDYIDYH